MSSRDADVERGLRHDHHEHYDCDERDRYDLEAGGLDQPELSLPPDINRNSECLIRSTQYLQWLAWLLSVFNDTAKNNGLNQ